MIVGYVLGILLVVFMLSPKDIVGLIGTSSLVGIVIFCIFFFPRSIIVEDGSISFVPPNSYERLKIKLSDIVKVESSFKIYNTVMIFTKSGMYFKLHPKDPRYLIEIVERRNH